MMNTRWRMRAKEEQHVFFVKFESSNTRNKVILRFWPHNQLWSIILVPVFTFAINSGDRYRRVSVYFLDGLGQKKTFRRSKVIFATVSVQFRDCFGFVFVLFKARKKMFEFSPPTFWGWGGFKKSLSGWEWTGLVKWKFPVGGLGFTGALTSCFWPRPFTQALLNIIFIIIISDWLILKWR